MTRGPTSFGGLRRFAARPRRVYFPKGIAEHPLKGTRGAYPLTLLLIGGRVDDGHILFIDDQRCDAACRVLPDMQLRLGLT